MAKNIITYAMALDYALAHCPDMPANISERLNELKTAIGKRNSAHSKAEAVAARKEKREAERAVVVNSVSPIIREVLTTTPQTDTEIYEKCRDRLPEGMTLARVRYMLSRGECGEDVAKEGNGRNPNTYRIVKKEA